MRPATAILCSFLLCASQHSVSAQSLAPASGLQDDGRGADILGAFSDSLRLLIIEHGTRIAFQEKTRRELDGNFWQDYRHSVRIPGQWNDTDAWWVNYIGHPIHGAAAGYIWLDHDRSAPPDLTLGRPYWTSRARATVWSAVYSVQFEIGPLSEASIGNVGMRPETTGWVDHVVTPMGAFGLIVAEDAMDRFIARWLEERLGNHVVRRVIRVALNPGRSLANASAGRAPWYREGRPLNWR